MIEILRMQSTKKDAMCDRCFQYYCELFYQIKRLFVIYSMGIILITTLNMVIKIILSRWAQLNYPLMCNLSILFID